MEDEEDEIGGSDGDHLKTRMSKAASHLSVASRATHLQNGVGVSYRQEAPIVNDKYFPRDLLVSNGAGGVSHIAMTHPDYDGFKFPHLQLRNITLDQRGSKGVRILDGINMEARGGELVAIMATKG